MAVPIKINITDELIKEITAGVKIVMATYKLGGSDVSASVEWQYRENIFVLIANDYFKYIDSGRRPKARKVPVEALIKWIKKKGITPRGKQSVNSLAFAIQNSIYKVGIKARKFIDPVIGLTIETLSEELAVSLSVQIADAIAEEMTFTLGKA
jgi:hypothetical protein